MGRSETSFLKNVTIGVTFSTLAQIANALVGVLVIRKIGPHERGVYAAVLTFNVMVTYLLDLGMSASNETFLGKREHSVGAVNCNSLIYSLGLGVLVFGGGFFCIDTLAKRVLPGIPIAFIMLALAMIPVTLYSLHAESILVGMEEILLLNKIYLLQTLVGIVGSVLFVLILNGGVRALFIVWAVGYTINAIVLFVAILRRGGFAFEKLLLGKSLRFGLRALLSRGLRLGSYRLDTLFVNGIMGPTAAGYYSVAGSLSEKMGPMFRAFTQAANRRITGAERQSSYQLTARLVRSLILFLVVALGPLVIGSHLAVEILFGRKFLPAVVPLRILLIGVAFFCVALILVLFFQNQMAKPGFASTVIALVVGMSSPLYLLAIPRWGLEGAALVTSFAFISLFVAFLASFLKASRMPVSDVLLVRGEDIERVIPSQRLKAWVKMLFPVH